MVDGHGWSWYCFQYTYKSSSNDGHGWSWMVMVLLDGHGIASRESKQATGLEF